MPRSILCSPGPSSPRRERLPCKPRNRGLARPLAPGRSDGLSCSRATHWSRGELSDLEQPFAARADWCKNSILCLRKTANRERATPQHRRADTRHVKLSLGAWRCRDKPVFTIVSRVRRLEATNKKIGMSTGVKLERRGPCGPNLW